MLTKFNNVKQERIFTIELFSNKSFFLTKNRLFLIELAAYFTFSKFGLLVSIYLITRLGLKIVFVWKNLKHRKSEACSHLQIVGYTVVQKLF